MKIILIVVMLLLSGCQSTGNVDVVDKIDKEMAIRESVTKNFCNGDPITSFSQTDKNIQITCGELWDERELSFVDMNNKPKLSTASIDSLISFARDTIKYDDKKTLKSSEGMELIGYYTTEIGSRVGCSIGSESRIKKLTVFYTVANVQIIQENYCVKNPKKKLMFSEFCSSLMQVAGSSAKALVDNNICALEANTPVKELDLSKYGNAGYYKDLLKHYFRPEGYSRSNKVAYPVSSPENFEKYLAWIDEAETTLCSNHKPKLHSLFNFSCNGSTYNLGKYTPINKVATYSTIDCPIKGFKSFTLSNNNYTFECK